MAELHISSDCQATLLLPTFFFSFKDYAEGAALTGMYSSHGTTERVPSNWQCSKASGLM